MSFEALRIEHHPDRHGYAFRAVELPSVQGGGATLDSSVAAAEHAVRVLLTALGGREIELHETRRLCRHVHHFEQHPHITSTRGTR